MDGGMEMRMATLLGMFRVAHSLSLHVMITYTVFLFSYGVCLDL
jgi:hypothetical protein